MLNVVCTRFVFKWFCFSMRYQAHNFAFYLQVFVKHVCPSRKSCSNCPPYGQGLKAHTWLLMPNSSKSVNFARGRSISLKWAHIKTGRSHVSQEFMRCRQGPELNFDFTWSVLLKRLPRHKLITQEISEPQIASDFVYVEFTSMLSVTIGYRCVWLENSSRSPLHSVTL